jgi:hypothetical protein
MQFSLMCLLSIHSSISLSLFPVSQARRASVAGGNSHSNSMQAWDESERRKLLIDALLRCCCMLVVVSGFVVQVCGFFFCPIQGVRFLICFGVVVFVLVFRLFRIFFCCLSTHTQLYWFRPVHTMYLRMQSRRCRRTGLCAWCSSICGCADLSCATSSSAAPSRTPSPTAVAPVMARQSDSRAPHDTIPELVELHERLRLLHVDLKILPVQAQLHRLGLVYCIVVVCTAPFLPPAPPSVTLISPFFAVSWCGHLTRAQRWAGFHSPTLQC